MTSLQWRHFLISEVPRSTSTSLIGVVEAWRLTLFFRA